MAWVNQPLSETDLAVVRHSVIRRTPRGDETWARTTAVVLGIESSLRPRKVA